MKQSPAKKLVARATAIQIQRISPKKRTAQRLPSYSKKRAGSPQRIAVPSGKGIEEEIASIYGLPENTNSSQSPSTSKSGMIRKLAVEDTKLRESIYFSSPPSCSPSTRNPFKKPRIAEEEEEEEEEEDVTEATSLQLGEGQENSPELPNSSWNEDEVPDTPEKEESATGNTIAQRIAQESTPSVENSSSFALMSEDTDWETFQKEMTESQSDVVGDGLSLPSTESNISQETILNDENTLSLNLTLESADWETFKKELTESRGNAVVDGPSLPLTDSSRSPSSVRLPEVVDQNSEELEIIYVSNKSSQKGSFSQESSSSKMGGGCKVSGLKRKQNSDPMRQLKLGEMFKKFECRAVSASKVSRIVGH